MGEILTTHSIPTKKYLELEPSTTSTKKSTLKVKAQINEANI